jgi:hypothetical protein
MLQRYYVDHLRSQEQKSGVLQRSCMPVLYIEISGGVLCVGGLAAIGRRVLSEPLMQPLQLYRSNFQQEMLALGRTMAAVRLTLGSLAAEQQAAFTRISPQPQWAGRPWLLCQGEYESWVVQRLWGDTVYLLTRQQAAAGSKKAGGGTAGAELQPEKLIAKFWQPQGAHAIGDHVQKAWHKQGVAPKVVSDSCCHVQRNNPLQRILAGLLLRT